MKKLEKPLHVLIDELTKKHKLKEQQKNEWAAICKTAYTEGSNDAHKAMAISKK